MKMGGSPEKVLKIKTWGAEAPHANPHFGRDASIVTCTKRQVGCRSIP